MKYCARLSTTPIRFSSSRPRADSRRASRMRRALLGARCPGTRSSISKGAAVHVHREQPVVLDGPAAFRVEIGVEALVVLIQYLVGLELVEPQQPVGLIEPVLAQQRRLGVERGQKRVLDYRHIG